MTEEQFLLERINAMRLDYERQVQPLFFRLAYLRSIKEPSPMVVLADHIKLTTQAAQLLCSVCREPQFPTPSGMTCKNGHGGDEGIESLRDKIHDEHRTGLDS